MRELATARYDRARSYLSRELAARTAPETLQMLMERLKGQTGEILDVRGEPGWHRASRRSLCPAQDETGRRACVEIHLITRRGGMGHQWAWIA